MNYAIEDCTVSNHDVVVMDELHILDNDQRGYLMEIMATKLLSVEQHIQNDRHECYSFRKYSIQ